MPDPILDRHALLATRLISLIRVVSVGLPDRETEDRVQALARDLIHDLRVTDADLASARAVEASYREFEPDPPESARERRSTIHWPTLISGGFLVLFLAGTGLLLVADGQTTLGGTLLAGAGLAAWWTWACMRR